MPSATKPRVPDVLPLVRRLYAKNRAGCCLHIVLDDGNVRDADVQFCVKYAQDAGHPECEELARALLLMSKTQRLRLGGLAHG